MTQYPDTSPTILKKWNYDGTSTYVDGVSYLANRHWRYTTTANPFDDNEPEEREETPLPNRHERRKAARGLRKLVGKAKKLMRKR